jgi:hypothetical protein
MALEEIRSTTEFLAEEVYLPGYMAIAGADYDRRSATFDFNVKEPPVARGSIVDYLTPRGLHICISQGSYALVEHMAREGEFGERGVESLREAALDGRLKIAELNQRFRREIEIAYLRDTLLEGRIKITELYQRFGREVKLGKPVQGRFDVKRFRFGRLPVLKLEFRFENDAVTGNMVSVIAPKPVPQTNIDIMRG